MSPTKPEGGVVWDARTPCGDCPYRKDSPPRMWHPEEFRGLLRSEREVMGRVYLCHKQNGRPCIGWVLDQRERNYPSLALRLECIRDPAAARCAEEAHTGGHPMHPSIEAMCRANGVRVPR